MKIRHLILAITAIALATPIYTSCTGDEPTTPPTGKPDDKADETEKPEPGFDLGDLTPGKDPWQTTQKGFIFEKMYDSHSTGGTGIELPNGKLFRYMICPAVKYKLYTIADGKLQDTGKTTFVSTVDIINMFANQLDFNENGELTVRSCLAQLSDRVAPSFQCRYTLNEHEISFSAIKQPTQSMIFNPIVTTEKYGEYSSTEGTKYWRYLYTTNENPNYCIRAEENPYVMGFIDNIKNFIVKYGQNKAFRILYKAEYSGKDFCELYPNKEVCRKFCSDVIIQFLYTMQQHSTVAEFNSEITKESLDKLHTSIADYIGRGRFLFTTVYTHTK